MAPTVEEHPVEAPSKEVDEVRTWFFNQHADAHPNKYDPRDVARARVSNSWIKHFLHHQKENIADAVKMMDAVLSWRKEFGVNDITEEQIALELRQRGALFFHSQNNSGSDIFHFRVKLNKKGDAEAIKQSKMLIAYLLDQYQRRNPLKRIVALLDMTDVGLANVDIDLTKYLITCFTTYFPGMLEYLLVYDMPWIVNAVWTLVKQMLSEDEQKHVLFCKKNSIQKYIDKDKLFKHMGGTDDYTFAYTRFFELDESETVADSDNDDFTDTFATDSIKIEEPADSTSTAAASSTAVTSTSIADSSWQTISAVNDVADASLPPEPKKVAKKQVNWAAKNDVKEFTTSPSNSGDSVMKDTPSDVPISSQLASIPVNNSAGKNTAYKVTIVPTSELQFTRPGINHEAQCTIKLMNDTDVSLAYKVKTTDPKNYKVKQGRGLLQPQHNETVSIVLLAGQEIKRDRFLVLSARAPSEDMTHSELANFWKTINKPQVHEHKLRCHEAVLELDTSVNHIPVAISSSMSTEPILAAKPLQQMTQGSYSSISTYQQIEQLHSEIRQVKKLLIVLISLMVLLLAVVSLK